MEATMAQTATLKVGDKAPDFSLADLDYLDGRPFRGVGPLRVSRNP